MDHFSTGFLPEHTDSDFHPPEQPPRTRPGSDISRSTPPTPTPTGESTVHSREVPAQQINDLQVEKSSKITRNLETGPVSGAASEIQVTDLSGTIIGVDWELDSLISRDSHSDLYSVKQSKPLGQSSVSSGYFVEAECEGRVFALDGIPDQVASSRRRNLKRLSKSVEVLWNERQEGRAILIYRAKPKPKLQDRHLQAYGQPSTSDENQALGSSENSKPPNTKQNENRRTKQQKRRQRLRESKRNSSVLPNGPDPPEPARPETEEDQLLPFQGSIKFITDLYNFDHSPLDSLVAKHLTEKQWDSYVQRSPTLWRLRSSDIKYQHFKNHHEMADLVQEMTKEISELKTHRQNLIPLFFILGSTGSDDCELFLSASMDLLRLKYAIRILPELVKAAESRLTNLEKRTQSAAQAYTKFKSHQDDARNIDGQVELKAILDILDKLKRLEEKSPAWYEVREAGRRLGGWKEYNRAHRLKYRAWVYYCNLLMPEIYQDDDSNSDGLDEFAAQSR
jgi:hypothetical protein